MIGNASVNRSCRKVSLKWKLSHKIHMVCYLEAETLPDNRAYAQYLNFVLMEAIQRANMPNKHECFKPGRDWTLKIL